MKLRKCKRTALRRRRRAFGIRSRYLWGGFGGCTVIRDAPRQMSMVRSAA